MNGKAAEKLTAYESTGLTPAGILRLIAEHDAAIDDLNEIIADSELCYYCKYWDDAKGVRSCSGHRNSDDGAEISAWRGVKGSKSCET